MCPTHIYRCNICDGKGYQTYQLLSAQYLCDDCKGQGSHYIFGPNTVILTKVMDSREAK